MAVSDGLGGPSLLAFDSCTGLLATFELSCRSYIEGITPIPADTRLHRITWGRVRVASLRISSAAVSTGFTGHWASGPDQPGTIRTTSPTS
jgi:hypothetical protein